MPVGTVPNATLDRVGSVLTRALDGLSIDQLQKQPAGPESNPIGWMAFHLSRVHDAGFSVLLGKPQLWRSDGWHEKFGLTPETGSLGGSTLDQVRVFNPVSAELLLAYWNAVRERSREFLEGLQEDDIDKPTPPGSGPANEVYRTTIARITSDTSQHIGQIAYARGLVDRHGWYGA